MDDDSTMLDLFSHHLCSHPKSSVLTVSAHSPGPSAHPYQRRKPQAKEKNQLQLLPVGDEGKVLPTGVLWLPPISLTKSSRRCFLCRLHNGIDNNLQGTLASRPTCYVKVDGFVASKTNAIFCPIMVFKLPSS